MSNFDLGRTRSGAGNYSRTLVKAVTSASVAGLAVGLWHNNTPGTAWPLMVGGGAAAFAAHWLWQMVQPRPGRAPALFPAFPALPAMPAFRALPPFRRLALPAPRRAAKPNAEAASKPKAAEPPTRENERDRLKAAGLSDADIAQLLMSREMGGNGARGGLGTGTATGFLNNLDAVLTHAKTLIPSLKLNLQRMFDKSADAATRISATVTIVVMIGAAGGLGYFLYLEGIEIRARALTTWAQACQERQKNGIAHMSMDELLSGKKVDGDDECGASKAK